MGLDKCGITRHNRICVSNATNTTVALNTYSQFVTIMCARASTSLTTDHGQIGGYLTIDTATSSTGSNNAAYFQPGIVLDKLAVAGHTHVGLSGAGATTQAVDFGIIEFGAF